MCVCEKKERRTKKASPVELWSCRYTFVICRDCSNTKCCTVPFNRRSMVASRVHRVAMHIYNRLYFRSTRIKNLPLLHFFFLFLFGFGQGSFTVKLVCTSIYASEELLEWCDCTSAYHARARAQQHAMHIHCPDARANAGVR